MNAPLAALLHLTYGDPQLAIFHVYEVKILRYSEIVELLLEIESWKDSLTAGIIADKQLRR